MVELKYTWCKTDRGVKSSQEIILSVIFKKSEKFCQ